MASYTDRREHFNRGPMDDWPDGILRDAIVWMRLLRGGPLRFYPDCQAAPSAYWLHVARRARILHRPDGGFEIQRGWPQSVSR
jgi:hypothetical protein